MTVSVSSLHSLPIEIIERILELAFYPRPSVAYNPDAPRHNDRKQVKRSLTPLHINGKLRRALWPRERIWQLIGASIKVNILSRGHEKILQMAHCNSGHTLEMVRLEWPELDQLDLTGILRCVEFLSTSMHNVKVLSFPATPMLAACRCPCCESDVEPWNRQWEYILGNRATSKPPAIEMKLCDDFWKLLECAFNLETLALHVAHWGQENVMQDLAYLVQARPSRLLFSAARWCSAFPEGISLISKVASKVRSLSLMEQKPLSNYGPDLLGYPASLDRTIKIYKSVLCAAQDTLVHLELQVRDGNIYTTAFEDCSFERLETLFVRYAEDRTGSPPSFKGDHRGEMPELKTIHVPGIFLNLLNAPAVSQAGIVIETKDDVKALTDNLADWDSLKTLALYTNMDPKQPNKAVGGIGQTIELLTKPERGGKEDLPCPQLEALGIYDGFPSWWKGAVDVEEVPRRWDWEEKDGFKPHLLLNGRSPLAIGTTVPQLVEKRKQGETKCSPIFKIRLNGFRILPDAEEKLKELEPGCEVTIENVRAKKRS